MRPTPSPPKGFKPYPTFRGWWIVGVSFLGLYLHGSATSYLFGVLVLPMEKDLEWSRTLLVGALTVSTLTGAAVGVVVGPLIDRHGARVGMTVGAALGGTFLLLLALVQAPWQYYLLLGIGIGATRTAVEGLGPRTVIANWFVRKRAAAFAWYSGGRAVFGVTAVAPIAYLVAERSWRSGWALLGAAELFVLAPLAWIIIRRRPEDQHQLPDGDTAPPPARADAPAAADGTDERHWTRAEAVRTPTFWMLSVAFVLTGFPASGIISNMLPYFEDRGLSFETSAWAFSLFGFGALLGRPVWGYVASRFGVRAGLTAYGVGYGLTVLGFVVAPNESLLFLSALPLGVTTGGAQQVASVELVESIEPALCSFIVASPLHSSLLVSRALSASPLVDEADIFGVRRATLRVVNLAELLLVLHQVVLQRRHDPLIVRRRHDHTRHQSPARPLPRRRDG